MTVLKTTQIKISKRKRIQNAPDSWKNSWKNAGGKGHRGRENCTPLNAEFQIKSRRDKELFLNNSNERNQG